MNHVLFNYYLPEVADKETRAINLSYDNAFPGLPAGEYTFLEMYCDEKGCDCRRVFFMVMSSVTKGPAAVITYGWESRQFYAEWMGNDDSSFVGEMFGLGLNLASPQSNLAQPLLNLTRDLLLKDQAYLDRLKRHYRMFKDLLDAQPDE